MAKYKPVVPFEYQGHQVIINSDRLVFQGREDILVFSDKAMSFSTNGSIHFDTSQNPESKFIINCPNIILGLKKGGNQGGGGLQVPTEPALKGEETTKWLKRLLDMVDELLMILESSYILKDAGPHGQNKKTFDENLRSKHLKDLKADLERKGAGGLKSERIFLV
jgi:hypothetical protein